MRIPFLIALLFSLAAGGVSWYVHTAAECPVPLTYRLGDINASFNLNATTARAHINEAVALWEAESSRDLFQYTDAGEAGVVVNFVFDERQQTSDNIASKKAALEEAFAENEEITRTVEALRAEYGELDASYRSRVAAYERDLAAHNAEVQKYNDRGGAPADVFAELQVESKALTAEADELNAVRVQLNKLAEDINRLGERGNRLIQDYNQNVAEFNDAYGYEREFTQGDYRAGVINIYKFSTDEELVRVLAHEFGHALGISHVEGVSSIMHYLLADSDEMPVLSVEDRRALIETCGSKETFAQLIRRHIRSAIQ